MQRFFTLVGIGIVVLVMIGATRKLFVSVNAAPGAQKNTTNNDEAAVIRAKMRILQEAQDALKRKKKETVQPATVPAPITEPEVRKYKKPEDRFTLMSREANAEYRSFLPKTRDKFLLSLYEKNLIFYTEKEMPRAYQNVEGLPGVHSPSYNVAAIKTHFAGNANRQFPWNTGAMLDDCPNARFVRFVMIPEGKSIRWWTTSGYNWRYPIGTVFGEVIAVRNEEEGKNYVCELRVRQRRPAGWRMDVFRPFTTAGDLVAAVKRIAPDESELVTKLLTVNAKDRTLSGPHFTATEAVEEVLPKLPKDIVVKLLTETPFKSAVGQTWRDYADDVNCNAPTVKEGFNVVPVNYDGTFLRIDTSGAIAKTCMRCHENTGRMARSFEPNIEWYGDIRGRDNIFSFHPFSAGSISYSGTPYATSLNQRLVNAGLLKPLNAPADPESTDDEVLCQNDEEEAEVLDGNLDIVFNLKEQQNVDARRVSTAMSH